MEKTAAPASPPVLAEKEKGGLSEVPSPQSSKPPDAKSPPQAGAERQRTLTPTHEEGPAKAGQLASEKPPLEAVRAAPAAIPAIPTDKLPVLAGRRHAAAAKNTSPAAPENVRQRGRSLAP